MQEQKMRLLQDNVRIAMSQLGDLSFEDDMIPISKVHHKMIKLTKELHKKIERNTREEIESLARKLLKQAGKLKEGKLPISLEDAYDHLLKIKEDTSGEEMVAMNVPRGYNPQLFRKIVEASFGDTTKDVVIHGNEATGQPLKKSYALVVESSEAKRKHQQLETND
ncbi:hypothetical protein HHI36_002540 [Cryptolaemus montrouzieri]|uniref:Uncharacterized protein n=1 Tax=Cryptolaemus montrouzieri TaxID=559131 RepID=A0ABD2PAX6_9CUCU